MSNILFQMSDIIFLKIKDIIKTSWVKLYEYLTSLLLHIKLMILLHVAIIQLRMCNLSSYI